MTCRDAVGTMPLHSACITATCAHPRGCCWLPTPPHVMTLLLRWWGDDRCPPSTLVRGVAVDVPSRARVFCNFVILTAQSRRVRAGTHPPLPTRSS